MTGALSVGNNQITNVDNPTNTQDAVTKYYFEQSGIPKFTVTSGNIPNRSNTNIILYMLPDGKTVGNGKITIAGLWVERGTGEWCDSNCGECNYR